MVHILELTERMNLTEGTKLTAMFNIEKSKEPPIERESRVTSNSSLAYIMNLVDITDLAYYFPKKK